MFGYLSFYILPFVSENHQGLLHGKNPWCSSSSGLFLAGEVFGLELASAVSAVK